MSSYVQDGNWKFVWEMFRTRQNLAYGYKVFTVLREGWRNCHSFPTLIFYHREVHHPHPHILVCNHLCSLTIPTRPPPPTIPHIIQVRPCILSRTCDLCQPATFVTPPPPNLIPLKLFRWAECNIGLHLRHDRAFYIIGEIAVVQKWVPLSSAPRYLICEAHANSRNSEIYWLPGVSIAYALDGTILKAWSDLSVKPSLGWPTSIRISMQGGVVVYIKFQGGYIQDYPRFGIVIKSYSPSNPPRSHDRPWPPRLN
ncbi:hypothetical protein BDD12DRAFT_839175 [Trichophaea hybrida]|nr:hypothetical protein BDD12DRAFT_839175 [Trichophaea hybrida]